MVNPFQSFSSSVDVRGFGGEILLSWIFPNTLPPAWTYYIFKRQGTAVTDNEITAYFARVAAVEAHTMTQKEADAATGDANIFVFRNYPNTMLRISDLRVENQKTYYYRALIQDTASKAISSTVDTNNTPVSSIAINVVDGKDIVARAFEKTIDAMADAKGNRPVIERDIAVYLSHARRKKDDMSYIVVSRAPGQISARFFNEEIIQDETGLIKGMIDQDIIRAEWFFIGNPERRDKFTAIMRIMRIVLLHFIKILGNGQIQDAKMIIGGDEEGQNLETQEKASTNSITIVLQIEQQIKMQNPYALPLTEIDTIFQGVYS